MKNQKGNTALVAVIILIVAVTAGAIGYLAVQKETTPKPVSTVPKTTEVTTEYTTEYTTEETGLAPSEFEGWQTYRNEKYGFEFQYPKDWGLALNPDDANALPFLHHKINGADAPDSDAISWSDVFEPGSSVLSSKGSLEANLDQIKKFRNAIDWSNTVPTKNGKAYYFVNNEPDPSGQVDRYPWVTIIGDSSAFDVEYQMFEKTTTTEQSGNTLKKIISTFRFTK